MTLEIKRADPTGVPPDDNPNSAVPLTVPDRAIIILGSKMFSSSNLGFISRSDQARRTGSRSNGRFGSTSRHTVSHGDTVAIPFEGVVLQSEVMKKIDQYVKDELGDLIFRKLIIVTETGVPGRFSPDQMRNYV